MMDHSKDTIRELVSLELSGAESLKDIGLGDGSVWDADTLDAPLPEDFPLIVVRWYDVSQTMGRMMVRPFDTWTYIKGFDRTPGETLSNAAVSVLSSLEAVVKLNGALHSIKDEGVGSDLRDDGYDALVLVNHYTSVYSGE